ncbi:MAG TPA: 50S ribosomal protein L10 [Chthonomonadaceae bacterium]|nr:50S ribosomal protein L10 [Chthonomonadaceae bacterium]
MPNAQKEAVVSDLRDIVGWSKGAILTDYRGLTVAEVTNLRRKLREVDAEYHIVKNTLFKIALGEAVTPELDRLLTGPTAIVFARSDVVAPTKAVLDFLATLRKPEIKVKGGWIDGKIYDTTQVTALSKLPPREQLISQLIGTLNGPMAEFVGTLDNIIGEFVRTIQAIHDKRVEGGEVAAPAAEAPAAAAETPAPVAQTPAEPAAPAAEETVAAAEPVTEEAAPAAEEAAPAATAEEAAPAEEAPAPAE